MPTPTRPFYYKGNRLQQLRGFLYAVQFGNISRAAKHMGLSQSSVSLQIKALEDDLKCVLFTRNGPNISLTYEGKKLFERAIPLIDGIQNLHEEFHQDLRDAKRTEIHIAANSTVKTYLLPSIIKDFTSKNPDLFITIHSAEHDDAMRLLMSQKVDLALLPSREHLPFPDQVQYKPIWHCKPCLITLPDHPLAGRSNLTVAEISKYELTLPDERLRVIPDLYKIFAYNKIKKRLRVNFMGSETGREYIEEGLAITISSNIWIRKKDVLKATPLSHLFADVSYGVVALTSNFENKKIVDFIESVRRHAKKSGLQG